MRGISVCVAELLKQIKKTLWGLSARRYLTAIAKYISSLFNSIHWSIVFFLNSKPWLKRTDRHEHKHVTEKVYKQRITNLLDPINYWYKRNIKQVF